MKLGNTEILFTHKPLNAADAEDAAKTISMQDDTPQRPQPIPWEAQQVPPSPPPPPPVSGVPAQFEDREVAVPHPIPPAPIAHKKEGATNWVLLSCAIIVLLALILVCLIVFALPQFGTIR